MDSVPLRSVVLLQATSNERVVALLVVRGRMNSQNQWRALMVTVLVATQGIHLRTSELFVRVFGQGT